MCSAISSARSLTAELAIARPQQVRRVMLWGAPCHSPQERAALLQNVTTPGTRDDGSDVAEEWQRMLERRGANVPPAALAEELGDRLRAGAHGTRALSGRPRLSDARAPAAGEAACAGPAPARRILGSGAARARRSAERLDAGRGGLRPGIPQRRPAAVRVHRARVPRPLAASGSEHPLPAPRAGQSGDHGRGRPAQGEPRRSSRPAGRAPARRRRRSALQTTTQHRLPNDKPRTHHGTSTTAASPQLSQNSSAKPVP